MENHVIKRPEFTISLDFELLWGVRDHADRDSYGRNILGGRDAILRMLDIFAAHDIRATWATVGMLFCENRDELLDVAPPEDLRPRYDNPALSSYAYLDELGTGEETDPYYFGMSLLKRVQDTPGQEIGTHTFSHFYCLEPGVTEDAFAADLTAARTIAERRGITLRSIVFPRNQYTSRHVQIAIEAGISVHRANQHAWPYRAASGQRQTPLRRAARLVDAHFGLFGTHCYDPAEAHAGTARASAFLRPASGVLGHLHGLHLSRILAGMTRAARQGQGYHLWWHPHNFGIATDTCLDALTIVVKHLACLRDEFGMISTPMRPCA